MGRQGSGLGAGRGQGAGMGRRGSGLGAGRTQGAGMSRGRSAGRRGFCRQNLGPGRFQAPMSTDTQETQRLRNKISALEEQIKQLTQQVNS